MSKPLATKVSTPLSENVQIGPKVSTFCVADVSLHIITREHDDVLAKYFAMFILEHYIAAQLIVKNCACGLDSNTHMILFLNDNDSAMSIKTVSHRECQWSLITHCLC